VHHPVEGELEPKDGDALAVDVGDGPGADAAMVVPDTHPVAVDVDGGDDLLAHFM